MEKILLAGGTGYIGGHLQILLRSLGHEVNVLSRSPEKNQFHWDPNKNLINTKSLEGITVIINLCGAGIADKRWSNKRKQILRDSRVIPARFLHNLSPELPNLKTYISASGINCYGLEDNGKIYVEDEAFGSDFTSQLVKEWETAADLFTDNYRVVKLRTAVVLSKDSEAFKKLSKPVKFGIGSPLGSGKQWMQIIHLNDICGAYLWAISNENAQGSYNVGACNIQNKTFMRTLAKTLKKPFFFPNIPSFLMRLLFGEMSDLLLKGVQGSSEKIVKDEFKFEFSTAEEILAECGHSGH